MMVRVGLRSWMMLVFLLVLLIRAADGQERGQARAPARSHIPETELRNLFLEADADLVLTGFREYDHLTRLRSDSILRANQARMDLHVIAPDDATRRSWMDTRVATFGMELGREAGGPGEGIAAALLHFVLQRSLRFGYEYARERVRAGSLSEMDYLFLPQGPGVTRTFNEVGFEARRRGETQSSRIWRDVRETWKNHISGEEE